ncbi:uncharacterized protein [Rutidosis leptorrhynchoides]|uniref:uncharacterized protein n=1 Tax=Rutidosis leptorrhynchoides TaxID=125765 RepID=UPI003A9941C9
MSETQKYHPALAISNIKNIIPITLDIKNGQYNSWSQLFKIHCRAYDVLDHILPTVTTSDASSTTTNNTDADPLWSRVDAIVLQWLYVTISNELRSTILEDDQTAAQAWTRIQSVFQDNKNTLALYLQRQFTNIKLDDFLDVSSYCQEIKTIADKLNNVGDKVTEPRMVLQLITGLNDDYDVVGTYFTQMSDLPSFYKARSKLVLEETRKQKQVITNSTSTESAMLTTTNQTKQPASTESVQSNNRGPSNFRYGNSRGCGRGSNNYRGRSNRGRGRANYGSNPIWNHYPPYSYQHSPLAQ